VHARTHTLPLPLFTHLFSTASSSFASLPSKSILLCEVAALSCGVIPQAGVTLSNRNDVLQVVKFVVMMNPWSCGALELLELLLLFNFSKTRPAGTGSSSSSRSKMYPSERGLSYLAALPCDSTSFLSGWARRVEWSRVEWG